MILKTRTLDLPEKECAKLNIVFDIVLLLSNSIMMVYFITVFNNFTFNVKKNRTLIPVVLVLFSWFVICHFLIKNIIISNVGIFVLLLFYGIVSSKKLKGIFPAIIIAVSFISVDLVVYYSATSLIKDFETLLKGNDTITWNIFELIQTILLFAVIKSVIFIIKPNKKDTWKSFVLTFIFSFTTFLGLWQTLRMITIDLSSESKKQLFIISVSFAITNLLLYILLYQQQKLLRIKYESQFLNSLASFEDEKFTETRDYLEEIKSIKHDMNQHFTIVNGFLSDNNIESCKEYIASVTKSFTEDKYHFSLGNRIVDYIVNYKLSRNNEIKPIVYGSLGNTSDIAEKDLACLLGNILDNAIEGALQSYDKKIDLCFLRQNLSRVIICKNSIDKSVVSNNPDLSSTKDEVSSHGYGTKIVRRIVTKYNGMIDYFEEDNMFCVQVIIPDMSGLSS